MGSHTGWVEGSYICKTLQNPAKNCEVSTPFPKLRAEIGHARGSVLGTFSVFFLLCPHCRGDVVKFKILNYR